MVNGNATDWIDTLMISVGAGSLGTIVSRSSAVFNCSHYFLTRKICGTV